jgi:L-ribulose-5-phosphate 3-epimerase
MKLKFAAFAKHLQDWPLAETCGHLAAVGFDGLDLTVRPGGYVEPSRLPVALVEAASVIRAAGLEIPLLTTGLTTATDPAAEPTFATADAINVRELKLHYWPWPKGQPLAPRLASARRDLDSLVNLARKYSVRINIHNHSGDHVQHSADIVHDLIKDHDPTLVGAYVDPAHFTIEGSNASYRAALETLAPRITLCAAKDFRWFDTGATYPAQSNRWYPLGSGNVRWPEVLTLLRASTFGNWISIHGEYQGKNSFADLSTQAVFQQMVTDRNVLLELAKSIPA